MSKLHLEPAQNVLLQKKALPFELVGPESIWDHYTIFLDWFISLAQFDRESAMHFMNNITTEECFTFVPLSLEEADKELSTDVASLRSHSMRSVAQAVFQSSHVNLLKIKNHTPDTDVDLTYAETFFLDQASRLIPSIFGRSPPMFVRLAETISTISRSIFWASHNQQ